MLKKITIIGLVLVSSIVKCQFVVPRSVNSMRNYYSVKPMKTVNTEPVFRLIRNSETNESPENYLYTIISSKNYKYDENIIQNDKNHYDDIKPQPIDVGPYEVIQRLDEIKYMVLWLNLYCGMHSDCDKIKLNEEIKKMVSAVILQK